MVQKVWVKQDAELRFREEKRREESPELRDHLGSEDILSREDDMVEVEDATITQRRHDDSCSCNGSMGSC